ncbi:serpin-ZX [Tanacetum coccineum]
MTRFGEFDYGSFESYKMVRFPYESGLNGYNMFKRPCESEFNGFSMFNRPYESGFNGFNMFKRPCESEFNGFNMFNRPYESEFNGFNMFKQPYESNGQSNEFSMYIFLPDRIDGLQDLLQLFQSDPSLFYRDFNLQRRRPDELWIPKFEMSCTFNAHDVMQQMGLTLPFDKKNKGLSGIVEQKHLNDKNLYVSKILQRSVIKVDEKGTEAAAVTTVMVAACSCSCPPPPARFVADHPFMFMIRENTSGTVFFSGVVVNPGIKS